MKITDYDRTLYGGRKPLSGDFYTDEEVLKKKRDMHNGVAIFLLCVGFFLVASGGEQYEWNIDHKLAAEKLIQECWNEEAAADKLGEMSGGWNAMVREECVGRAYYDYQAENVPKYWGWGKIRWKIDNWCLILTKNHPPPEPESPQPSVNGMPKKRSLSTAMGDGGLNPIPSLT